MEPGSPRSKMIICRSSTPPRICGSSSVTDCRTRSGSRSGSARPPTPRTTCGWVARSADGIAESDRKVMLIASGALSHTFGRCANCASTRRPARHIFTAEAAAADHDRMAWFERGDHARVLETMPEFYRYKPEARFGHYLMMIGALGEGDCTATGRRYGEYENSIGTGRCTTGSTGPTTASRGRGVRTRAADGRTAVHARGRI